MDTTVQQTLSVNGDVCAFDASLANVLDKFGVDVAAARGVAVAVNDDIVRKKDWTTHILNPDDRVEIVTARQGG